MHCRFALHDMCLLTNIFYHRHSKRTEIHFHGSLHIIIYNLKLFNAILLHISNDSLCRLLHFLFLLPKPYRVCGQQTVIFVWLLFVCYRKCFTLTLPHLLALYVFTVKDKNLFLRFRGNILWKVTIPACTSSHTTNGCYLWAVLPYTHITDFVESQKFLTQYFYNTKLGTDVCLSLHCVLIM